VNLEQIGTYLARSRLVDLTKKVVPGKAKGPFETGSRLYEIEPFSYPPGELMHRIRMESHISTHLEAPSHYVTPRYGRKAKDISELPLKSFIGLAVLINCKDFSPRTAIGRHMLESFRILEHDIVLLGNSPYTGDDRCFLAKDGAEYLVEKKVKMLGVDDSVFGENPRYRLRVFEKYHTHDLLLSNNIPIIEGLANLDKIGRERFLFFGIPARMGGLESFPIRAVAAL
jgi:kynurenine formamidase